MVKSFDRFEPLSTFGLVASAPALAYLEHDNKHFVCVGALESIYQWNIKTGELEQKFEDGQIPPRTRTLVLAHDKTNDLLASGYSDGSIRVWDLKTASCIITFNGHKAGISALEFDSSGTRLVSGGQDTAIIVWDLISESGVCRLKGHKGPITSVNLATDSWLLSTSKDGIIKVWDLDTQFCVETKVAHTGECWAAIMHGKQVFTASNTIEIKIWDFLVDNPEGDKLVSTGTLEKGSRHRSIALLHNSGYLYCASIDQVQIWRVRTESELKTLVRRQKKRQKKKAEAGDAEADNAAVGSIEDLQAHQYYVQHATIRPGAKIQNISLSDKSLVLALANNSIETWSYTEETPERLRSLESPGHRTDVRDLSISQDGRLLVSGSNGLLKLYNTRTTNCIRTIDDAGYILCLRFLPGDALVVVGTKEGNLDLYDVITSTKLGSYPAHAGGVWSLDLTMDGTTIASGGADKSVKFWTLKVEQQEVPGASESINVMTLKNTTKLEFNDDVLAVKFSPDAKYIAASLLDNTIKVYYKDTLKFFLNLYGHQLPVLSIDISHDSKLLISSSADKNIKIWGLDFGDCHKSIFAHEDSILKVAFEPQSNCFFSCSKDGYVKRWDGRGFAQIQKLEGHQSEVWALAMAPDGSFVATASHDKSIRIWEHTDEPLFLEEERENELEQIHEENIIQSLEQDQQQPQEDGETQDTAEQVNTHTLESLKAGERFYEALEICIKDLEEKPNPRNVILATLNVAPERYLIDVLSKIKSNLVEDALLTFPLDQLMGLLNFILIWLQKKWNVPLVTRVLLFCLRNFHRQIVANRMMQAELEEIKTLLRNELTTISDNIGRNLAYIKYLQSQWDLDHIHTYEDTKVETSKKRYYSTPA